MRNLGWLFALLLSMTLALAACAAPAAPPAAPAAGTEDAAAATEEPTQGEDETAGGEEVDIITADDVTGTVGSITGPVGITGAEGVTGTDGITGTDNITGTGDITGTGGITGTEGMTETDGMTGAEYGDVLTDPEQRAYYTYIGPDEPADLGDFERVEAGESDLVGEGLDQSLLGTQKVGGVQQVTYHDRPLFRYTGDANPGDTLGQGQNDFYLISPAGEPIEEAE